MSKKKEQLNVAETGGHRFNGGKDPISMAPYELDMIVSWVLFLSCDENGGKYPRRNWMKGLPHEGCAESGGRHLKKRLQRGEVIDMDSGIPHTWLALCNLGMLVHYELNHPELNNMYAATNGKYSLEQQKEKVREKLKDHPKLVDIILTNYFPKEK